MKKMLWRGELSLNIMEIDAQHIQFIDLTNKTREKLNSRLTEEDANEIFLQLEAYIANHFALEEKYFDEFCYEQAEQHIKEHRKAIKKVSELKEKYEQKKSFLVIIRLLEFMDDWIVSHIMNHDKKYIECFRSHGIG